MLDETRSATDPTTAGGPRSPQPPSPVRAQLLATEHWSLLATRGLAWSEVMSRISVHLTVTSAALVVLALATQATGFGAAFHILAIGLTSAILLLGTMTAVRVHNASREDVALVQGMNRLRAAYVDLDPGLADYLVTSHCDDQAGLMRTYTMGMPRSRTSHIVGGTSLFIHIVNSLMAGALGALVAHAATGDAVGPSICGVLAGSGYLSITLEGARRSFAQLPLDARFPSPGPPAAEDRPGTVTVPAGASSTGTPPAGRR
jgi:hypothetical protein